MKITKQGAADFFKKLLANIPKIEAEILNKVIRIEAEHQVARNFRAQGFEETTGNFTPWAKRKKDKERPNEDNELRNLLIGKGKGKLRASVVKGRVQGNEVIFKSDLDYARIHNEGGTETYTQNVKKHTRKRMRRYEGASYHIKGDTYEVDKHTRTVTRTMPKRQYIGESEALDDKIRTKIHELLKKKLKP